MIAADQRWSRDSRCLICGGCERDPRGLGKRCAGFLSADGLFARCTREEYAGALRPDGSTAIPCYVHFLRGICRCGTRHEGPVSFRPRTGASATKPVGQPIQTISAVLEPWVAEFLKRRGLGGQAPGMYAARTSSGPALAFRYPRPGGDMVVKVRNVADKSRQFCSPTGAGPRPLYGWHRLADITSNDEVSIVEGELDLHSFRAAGIYNVVSVPDGAHTRLTPALLAPLERFARVVLAVDADAEGEGLAQRLADALGPARCRRVRFAGHKDANDALRAGWRREDFMRALAGAIRVAA